MAALAFYTNGILISNSGLGFYGPGGFGASVPVSEWQDNTYITNAAGTSQGPQGKNVKWIHSASGEIPTSVRLPLTSIPNADSTLNIRFTHGSAVKTQNARLRIYDRVSIDNPASGVTTAVAMIVHPNPSQVAGGSGNTTWQFPAGTGYLNFSILSNGAAFSPGISGNNPNVNDTQHDWYAAISSSPDSVGSKTSYGLYFQTEYY